MAAPSAPPPQPVPGRAWGPTLAFVAGYVDTLGFVALFGLFTAHVTGNFVLIGKELSGHGEGVLLKLLAFPAFIAAVVGARLLSRALGRRGRSAVRPLLIVQAGFLLAFMGLGLMAMPFTSPDSGLALATGMLGAVAMGVQNAQSRLELGALVPTTVMTGNVTQVVIDLVDLLDHEPSAERAAARARLGRMAPAVAGFAVGAIGGAVAWKYFGFAGLLLPVVLVLALAARQLPAPVKQTG